MHKDEGRRPGGTPELRSSPSRRNALLHHKPERFPSLNLKEPQRLWTVAHQKVLCLLVMLQYHLVRFAAKAGLLITAKRRVCWIEVITICPDSAGLDLATNPVGGGAIA